MGDQNPNAPGRNPSGNPENKDTSVTYRAPGNPITPPSEQTPQNGGQGKVGGPYGVIIRTGHENAYGESQNIPSNVPKDASGKPITAETKLSEYSASLIRNAGLKEGTPEFNAAIASYLQANSLREVTSNQESDSLSLASKALIKPEDYGYTKNAVLDTRITNLGEDKSPLEINFDTTQGGLSARSGKAIGKLGTKIISGGVETPQSKALGDKFSSEKLNASLPKNNDKISSISFSNLDYATGGTKDKESVVTIGPKEERVFGKTSDDQFGWHDIGKDQLVRDSTQEKVLNTTLGATSTFKEGMGTPLSVSLSDKDQIRSSNDIFLTSRSGQTSVLVAKPESKPQSEGLLGSSTSFSKDEIDKQNRDYADYIGGFGQQGATVNLFSNGKLVGSVSGKNAYRDAIIMSREYPGGLQARVVYSTTREGKDLINSLLQNARETNAPNGSILVFDTSKSVSPLQDQTRVVASIPLSNAEKELPSVIDKYAGNPNIKFGSFGTSIDTPQKTTTVPSSILPLDLANLSSKAYTGKYFDLDQFLGGLGEQAKSGISRPLLAPNATTNQFGISLPDISPTLKEFGSNFGSFIAGGVKTFPPLLASLGTSYYNVLTTGSSGGPRVQTNSTKALAGVIAQSLVEPSAFMGVSAKKNYDVTAGFIHENIGNPIREQGFITPQPVSSPKTIGAFGGTLAGIGTMFPTDLVPLRVVDLPFSIVTKEGKVFSQPKGLALGYGGERSVPIVLKTPEGYKVFPNVKNTVTSVLPGNTGSIKYGVSRTQETSTLQGYQSKVINSEPFRSRVDELGLNVKNTGKPFPGGALQYNAMEAARLTEEVAKGTQKAKNTGPLRPLASEEQASISPSVITPLGETIAKQQSPGRKVISLFTLFKVPSAKNVQGSQLTFSVLSKKGAKEFVEMRGGPHDVDITTGTPFSFREETNAANAAQEAQLNIARAQGISPTENTAYRGLDVRDLDEIIAGRKRLEETSTTPEVYASPESGTALFFGKLFHGSRASLAKLTYENENNVLRFRDIPKASRGGKNPIQNWRTSNPLLIDYARRTGAAVLRKPVKTGGQEDIILDTSVVKNIEKISPDIQVTRQEGKRLYANTPEGEEKIAEFLTKHDSTETGSMMGKASKVYGENIATKSFKYEVPGSTKKISGFGRKYQTQTQFARTGLFTKEQAEGHNASERQLELIGEKTAFGPELYKKSAIIDAYLLTRDQARELMKSPRTRAEGKSLFESNEKLLKIQADLYEIDLSKPLVSSGRNDYDLSSIAQSGSSRGSSNLALISAFGNPSRLNQNTSSTISFPSTESAKSRVSSSVLDSSLSARISSFSRLSAYSAKSGYSPFSATSIFSGSSGKSGKSGKSGSSSVLSSFSGLSALSSMPSVGLSPGPSGASSGKSGSNSNASAFSGVSALSGFSGFSRMFGSSVFNNQPFIFFPPLPQKIGRKRKVPKGDRYTALFKFDVKNPFSTSLSIIEKGNLTWL